MKKVILPLLVIGVIAGGAALYHSVITSRAEELVLEVGQDAVYVADQPITSTVSGAFASPSKQSFLVISTYSNGAAGERLGVSELLTARAHNDVSVPLSRTMQDGEMLIAQFYKDNDDGVFDENDNILQDANDDAVFVIFFARVDAVLPNIAATPSQQAEPQETVEPEPVPVVETPVEPESAVEQPEGEAVEVEDDAVPTDDEVVDAPVDESPDETTPEEPGETLPPPPETAEEPAPETAPEETP